MTWKDAKEEGYARADFLIRRMELAGADDNHILLTDFSDEATYNLLKRKDADAGWSFAWFRMVLRACRRRLRTCGYKVDLCVIRLDEYLAWLAKEKLNDSDAHRAAYINLMADQ